MTLTPKQRAKRMAKAMDHFEKAYVLLNDELRDHPHDDEELQSAWIFFLDGAHSVVRQLRWEAEAAQNESGSPKMR